VNTASRAETQDSSPLCPKCGSEKVGWSDTNELKCQCGHLFEPPEHLKGKGPSEAEKQWKREPKEGSTTQLLERPTGASFEWYLKGVVHFANKEGATLPGYADSLNSPGNEDNSLSYWIEGDLKLYLNTAKAKEDWSDVLREDKKAEEVSSPQYCLDYLLVDSEVIRSATVKNAEALSPAVLQELRKELQLYLGADITREKAIDNELRELEERGKLASVSLVSERLGVGTRQVRKLAEAGELDRVKGKYYPASVFKLLKKRGETIFF